MKVVILSAPDDLVIPPLVDSATTLSVQMATRLQNEAIKTR